MGTSTSTEPSNSVAGTRPRVAYLVLTHKDPVQVETLADRIRYLSPVALIVVHHDLKAPVVPWGGHPPPGIDMIDRSRVEWGDWSIVDATLRMMRRALDLRADWVVVLSGEHWPVTDLASWEESLSTCTADALLPALQLPERLHFGRKDVDGNRFLARSIHRWAKIGRPRSNLLHRALMAASKASRWTHPVLKLEFSLRSEAWFIGLPRRRGPVKGWPLFKGSEWIACSASAVRALTEQPPAVMSWFARSHIPDECYFHSVLHHASGLVVRDVLVTWVPPEPVEPTPAWMLLKDTELSDAFGSGAAFARKIDLARNREIARSIDRRVDEDRGSRGADALEGSDVRRI
jgi:hypothetical protein